MSQPSAARADLLVRLKRAQSHAESLAALRRQISQALAEVGATISGTATGTDRRVMADLQLSLDQLDQLIARIRAAVEEGRQYANTL